MKLCILQGSPRKNGNTQALVLPFAERMKEEGHRYKLFWLYDMNLEPCHACRNCQEDWSKFNCRIRDDMQIIFDSIMESDLIVLASPIYSWYCTPPLKVVLDRCVYGMNKYYGDTAGPSLWAEKNMALITTCGYKTQNGADLWEEGIRRYCKHSKLHYLSMMAERHMGYKTEFMDETKRINARKFADKVIAEISAVKINGFSSRR